MSSALDALAGVSIRRVDVPEPDLLALTISRRDLHGVLIISAHPRAPGIGLVEERPRGAPASAIAMRLRGLLTGARLEAVLVPARGTVAIDLRRGDEALALIHEQAGRASNVLVLDAQGKIAAALRPAALSARGLRLGDALQIALGDEPQHSSDPEGAIATLTELGAQLTTRRAEVIAAAQRTEIARAIRRAIHRLERRADATAGDLERAQEVPRLREDASAILAKLHEIPRDATSLQIAWDEQSVPRRISIDPTVGPRATADALFDRARRLEAGSTIARRRHDEARAGLAALRQLEAELEAAPPVHDHLAALAARARALGATLPRAEAPAAFDRSEAHAPYRCYVGHGERAILVGRTAADNDELTFRVARSHDLWMHVRGTPGSHVVVPLEKNEECPPELLIDAAHLAAHFSKARAEDRVEIAYTRRGRVRKPKHGAPGKVAVTGEKTFLLRVDRHRLDRLLAPRA